MARLRVLVLLIGLAAGRVFAAEAAIAVIAGPQAPTINYDRQTLKDIFLKRIVVDASGVALAPLNLPPADPLRQAFSLALWGQPPEAKQHYWNERYFSGVTPPYVVRSQEAMLRFVADTPGAVGYVSDCLADARVTVVARLPAPAEWAARLSGVCPE
ncbi:MAG: hypothetical protein PHR30_06535 [Gallionellaceae bacterium]|nr:hypothetical protein [Gallionellaceae bacterium]